MDINKIFGTFGSSSRNDDFPPANFLSTSKIIEDNHPRYYLKMFVKLIQNYTLYSKQLFNFFSLSDPSLNIQEIEQVGKIMLHERAFEYLKEIDLQDKYHIKILFEEANKELEQALNKSLKHFEEKEEYEKCAVLKKYLDFLNFPS